MALLFSYRPLPLVGGIVFYNTFSSFYQKNISSSGPGCSKLMSSLDNVLLKLQTLIS